MFFALVHGIWGLGIDSTIINNNYYTNTTVIVKSMGLGLYCLGTKRK